MIVILCLRFLTYLRVLKVGVMCFFWVFGCNRGYSGSKLSNNVECEIFQTLLEEAKESYPEDIVRPLKSDSIEDISANLASLTDWVRRWQPST